MLEVIITLCISVASLFFAEYSRKHRLIPIEVSRKLAHIVMGSAVATWPFFVSYTTIVIVSAFLFLSAMIVKRIGAFKNVREIGRLSWGEFFFPAGLIVTALLEPNPWVFAAAMLLLAIADSAAAIVGTAKGKHSFIYMGHKKSLEGSAAFLVVSICITSLLLFVVPSGLENVPAIVALLFPIVITSVEALAPFGSDNLLIPIITAGVFTLVF